MKGLAFVLGGGGARGALQVGALRALLEAGERPEMLVGTSIGAVNSAFMALHGAHLESVSELEAAWLDTPKANLLPPNYLWLTVRALFRRRTETFGHRLRAFFVEHGISPELRFGELSGVRLYIVAADLNNHRPVIYGQNPDELVLEALLASTALPPWVPPIQKEGEYLMDGGAVSPLPIEPALRMGARRVVALDITDPRPTPASKQDFGVFISRLIFTVELRQIETEIALAEARGVRVQRIAMRAEQPTPLWDFAGSRRLIELGYQIAQESLAAAQPVGLAGWLRLLLSRLHGEPASR
ncbi:MAG: patatin-like phospholipase family protein [Anaerolineales bacterium]|nr:patatin-like phospholipase family protein [Anaerolineales bacterium]